ncbi:MAG: response regulator transcription factor [Chloroflexi bacterium]|nr:response regulator transcription factor [Chloroflexota bacterium]
MSAGRIRVILADDHTLFRQGLKQLLERQGDLEVVGEANDGLEAVEKTDFLDPDVVLMDLNMPGIDGIKATRLIVERKPNTRVIVLTMYRHEENVLEAVKAGARGYLPKTLDSKELVRGVRAVHRGEALVKASVALKVLDELRQSRDQPKGRGGCELTERDKDVLRLVARGASNRQIAEQLCLAEKTVENRLSLLFEKLHLDNRVQATLYALRQGLVSLEDHTFGEVSV